MNNICKKIDIFLINHKRQFMSMLQKYMVIIRIKNTIQSDNNTTNSINIEDIPDTKKNKLCKIIEIPQKIENITINATYGLFNSNFKYNDIETSDTSDTSNIRNTSNTVHNQSPHYFHEENNPLGITSIHPEKSNNTYNDREFNRKPRKRTRPKNKNSQRDYAKTL